jgi:hypothetical protein
VKRSRRLSTIYIRPQPRELAQPQRAEEASNGSDTTIIHLPTVAREKLFEKDKQMKPSQAAQPSQAPPNNAFALKRLPKTKNRLLRFWM